MSYVGQKNTVYRLLQVLSHKGRAYCSYQQGIKGFIVSRTLKHDKWDVRVPTKEPWRFFHQFQTKLPKSIGIAIVLSYYGTKDEVYALFQILNHDARAHCFHDKNIDDFATDNPSSYKHLSKVSRQGI